MIGVYRIDAYFQGILVELNLNTSMVFMVYRSPIQWISTAAHIPQRVGYQSLQYQQMTIELWQTKGRAQ
jgi:hypothetical protein